MLNKPTQNWKPQETISFFAKFYNASLLMSFGAYYYFLTTSWTCNGGGPFEVCKQQEEIAPLMPTLMAQKIAFHFQRLSRRMCHGMPLTDGPLITAYIGCTVCLRTPWFILLLHQVLYVCCTVKMKKKKKRKKNL